MIDLRKKFPRYKYEVDYEGVYEESEIEEEDRVYHINLVCKNGFISIYDESYLHVIYEGNSKSIIKKILEIPNTELLAEGDVETVFKAPIVWARRVFQVMKPKLNAAAAKKIKGGLNKK